MQRRTYPEQDGWRLWLNPDEQRALLETVDDDPRRRIAFALGLHGLRSEEIVRVTKSDTVKLPNGSYGLQVRTGGKSGERQLPISEDLHDRIYYLANAAQLTQGQPLVDVTRRQVRNWITKAREKLAAKQPTKSWADLGSHDLRRTWATETYYRLAAAGVPIAEDLVLGWGGWSNSENGRDTFRKSYLGPVPDHVTAAMTEHLTLP